MKKSIAQVFTSFFLFGVMAVQAQEQEVELANYLRNAQYQQAIEYIDSQEEPVWDWVYQKALCYKWLSNYSKAIEILENLQENYPDNIPIQLELAQCYEINLRYPQSIYWYQKLVEADPENAYFQVRKADLLYRAEKYTRALEEFLQIDPERYHPGYLKKSIALCYEKLNQPDSAKVYYLAACETDPGDVFSALSLVKLYVRQEDYSQALLYSEAFLKADTTNAQMNVLNAFAYYNLNVYEEAIRRFEKCHAAGDSSLMVYRSLGISHFFQQNDSEALPYLQQAYERDSTNMTVLYALALVSYNLGHYPEAIGAFQKLVQQALPNPNALYSYYKGLAQAYEKNGIYNRAVGNYISANTYASTNTQKMDLLFSISTLFEFNLKDYTMAVVYYKQYYASLLNYESTILDQDGPDSEEAKAIQLKLTELDKHIQELQK